MITEEDLKRFLDWPESPQSRILSVYLNVEPSGDEVLHRRFETAFKAVTQLLKKKTTPVFHEDLQTDVGRAREFVVNYKPAGHGLVVFADESKGFLWAKELNVHFENQAHWLGKPYLLPLLEALDEWERYGVVLVDKRRARIFTYCLGEIEEEKAAIAPNDVKHFRSSGKDNLRSAFKLQRTAEMHESWHLKNVSQLVSGLARRYKFNRLILSGPKDTVDELSKILPKSLRSRIAGRLFLPVDVAEKDLAEALLKMESRIERDEELKLVKRFIQTDPADTLKVCGIDAVLVHLDKGRIRKLIYSENFDPSGSECRACGYLFSNGRMVCGRCNASIDPVSDLLEEMTRRVLTAGGTIEEVKGEAARLLDEAGGVGAYLKRKNKR